MRQATPTYELLRTAFADADSDLPRYRVLYQAMRQAIIGHRLPPGTRLPSTRELARELALSRNTVLATFEGLLAEGFIVSRPGSGTYVAEAAATPRARPARTSVLLEKRAPAPSAGTAGLSQRGLRLALFQGGERFEIQPLGGSEGDFTLFPIKQWQRLQSRQLRLARPELLDYSAEGGYFPLRQAIADYVRVSRAVRVEVEQVLITAGTQHSLDLCAQLLTDAGDRVWVEDPCYWGARAIFEARELRLDPVAVDQDGLDPSLAPAGSHPRLIYLTPSNQYPTGTAMSLSRRRSVLEVATREQAWILEDDYDSELRYAGRPLASLQGLDTEQRVIYMGTFSKVLYPGIKIGYLVLPHSLVGAFRSALYDLQRPGQMPVQAALADFIQRGYFTTHVRRLRLAYAEAREHLLQALKPVLDNGSTRVISQNAGVHLVLQLPEGVNDENIARQLADNGVHVSALSRYFLGKATRPGLIIGYGYSSRQRILQGGRIIAQVLGLALGSARINHTD